LKFGGDKDSPHERIRSRIELIDTTTIDDRKDIGIITVRLVAEKHITDAGMRALEAARFAGIDNIFEDNGNKFLRVLTLEQVLAVPTSDAFK
jgi:hypothetical protein